MTYPRVGHVERKSFVALKAFALVWILSSLASALKLWTLLALARLVDQRRAQIMERKGED